MDTADQKFVEEALEVLIDGLTDIKNGGPGLRRADAVEVLKKTADALVEPKKLVNIAGYEVPAGLTPVQRVLWVALLACTNGTLEAAAGTLDDVAAFDTMIEQAFNAIEKL